MKRSEFLELIRTNADEAQKHLSDDAGSEQILMFLLNMALRGSYEANHIIDEMIEMVGESDKDLADKLNNAKFMIETLGGYILTLNRMITNKEIDSNEKE